jgi:2-keto-4-pentenoate hydratase
VLTAELHHTLARRLVAAERSRTPIAPLTDEHPDLTLEDAYGIQVLLLEARKGERTGYKLGFTSAPMREQMGIAGPNHGRLTADMRVDRQPIALSALIHPRVEPEVAVLVERDLTGPGVSAPHARSAVRWAMPALEVVDSRFRDYRFRLPDNTADNSSAARFVLGEPRSLEDLADLRSVEVALFRDDERLDSGFGSNAMGDPLEAVAWLANALCERGTTLEAGSVVLTGGLTRAHPAGGTFVADFGRLGRVRTRFA